MAQNDEKAELRKRVQQLRAKATQDYLGNVSKMAERTALAKVRGLPVDDPDGRKKLRKARDPKIIQRDLMQQVLAGTAPKELPEKTIGVRDFLKIDYFIKGLVAARSVGRIEALGGLYFGSGFICAPGMIMTNHHVLPSASVADRTHIGFETYDGLTVIPKCQLSPSTFWWTNPDLDVSIVALDPARGETISDKLGWHPLLIEQGKIALGDPASVIQYPEGRMKSVVVHDSTVVFLKNHRQKKIDQALWYTCDTEPGSSGSPVFNKHWEIVAVHHASVPAQDEDGNLIDEDGQKVSEEDYERDPNKVLHIANKGIRASRIVHALNDEKFKDNSEHLRKKEDILQVWSQGSGQSEVLRLMRERISNEWVATMASAMDDEDAPRFIGATLERSRPHGSNDTDLFRLLMDYVGPEGSVDIRLVRGPDRTK